MYTVKLSEKLSKPNNPRYVIIDKATGTVKDNAGGWGYKTEASAEKVINWWRKNEKTHRKKEKEKNHLKAKLTAEEWLHENDDFASAINLLATNKLRNYVFATNEVSPSNVNQLLQIYGIKLDGFSTRDLITAWEKSKKKRQQQTHH